MKHVIIILIRFYQIFLRDLNPKTCIYFPSCSEYAIESLRKNNFLKGVYMAAKRVVKCNPFYEGGYDPVKKT